MPASGVFKGDELKDFGSKGYFWSCMLNDDAPNCAYRLFFDYDTVGATYWYGRYYGYNVRPVVDKYRVK